jgi:hypothetical protein
VGADTCPVKNGGPRRFYATVRQWMTVRVRLWPYIIKLILSRIQCDNNIVNKFIGWDTSNSAFYKKHHSLYDLNH